MRITDRLPRPVTVPATVQDAGLHLADLGLYTHVRAALDGYSHPPLLEDLAADVTTRIRRDDTTEAHVADGIHRLLAAGVLAHQDD